MYFSLITPAPGHERDAAHEWTRGAYTEHQWIWRFLPAPAGTARSFLFRRREVDGLPRFYVVSESAPQAPSGNWLVTSKPYSPALSEGDILAFELRANPVVTTRTPEGKAVRHDVVMQEKTRLLHERGLTKWADWTTGDRPGSSELIHRTCSAWLQARCQKLGIALVDQAELRVEGYEQHRGKGGALRVSTVDFAGHLRVVDPLAMQQALFGGIGHAKAFGCGLLLVRPVA